MVQLICAMDGRINGNIIANRFQIKYSAKGELAVYGFLFTPEAICTNTLIIQRQRTIYRNTAFRLTDGRIGVLDSAEGNVSAYFRCKVKLRCTVLSKNTWCEANIYLRKGDLLPLLLVPPPYP